MYFAPCVNNIRNWLIRPAELLSMYVWLVPLLSWHIHTPKTALRAFVYMTFSDVRLDFQVGLLK